jgi:hypothetical protein
MTCIPLGKIQVPTPGTPVAVTLTAAQAALLPASQVATRIEIWADTADTGISFVKDAATGNKIASLPVPANGNCEHWHGSLIDPLKIAVDSSVANDGPIVTIWVA